MACAIASLLVFPLSFILAAMSLSKHEGVAQGAVAILIISSLIIILVITLGSDLLTGNFGLFK